MRIILKKRSKGITLTELMCVLAIIGILMALYLPTLSRIYVHVKHELLGD